MQDITLLFIAIFRYNVICEFFLLELKIPVLVTQLFL